MRAALLGKTRTEVLSYFGNPTETGADRWGYGRRMLLDPDTNMFLSADELRRRFEAIGAMDRQVINYCGGGIAASADALALVMLGHPDVRLYDASMSEWANDPSLPMETG